MAHTQDYEEGYRDGRILNLENEVKQQGIEIKSLRDSIAEVNTSLSKSIRGLERIFWLLGGMVALIQFMPYLTSFMGMVTK